MKVNKKKCVNEITGKVIGIRSMGLERRTMIYVGYSVDGKEYTLEESIKYKSEAVKLGFLPVGQKRVPVMGDIAVGASVRVMCDPDNPAEAFLKDNIGKANI